jgi:hypothetical protein
MSRTYRDNQRRIDHKAIRTLVDLFNSGMHDTPKRPYRDIPRHGCNRKYYATMKVIYRRRERKTKLALPASTYNIAALGSTSHAA